MKIRLALVLVLAPGCGATVVFPSDDDGTGGTSDGGAPPAFECVLACGEPCTKCIGDECFTGECSEDGICHRPADPPVCPH